MQTKQQGSEKKKNKTQKQLVAAITQVGSLRDGSHLSGLAKKTSPNWEWLLQTDLGPPVERLE